MATAKRKTVTYPLVNQAGEKSSTMRLNAEVFGIEPNTQVVYDAVQVYLSNRRQATAKTKYRSEVSGGGKKPWRQKGTGRARAGSSRSTIWVGGGKVHTPDGNQNYKLSMNKSAHDLALKSALSAIVESKVLILLEDLKLSGKTKEAVEVLKNIEANGKVLLVADYDDVEIERSVSNLPGVKLVKSNNVSVYDLVNSDKVVLLKDVVKVLTDRLVVGGNE
ncbi:MAG TPA: 50S ribosomal protein L4 [Bacilli bacterium]|nr:50S ribosomal protein L4 [Bacilli bacterium]HKM11512.1 50S ribosomal protein L4 [Bacilli bacterium]